mmetsp:Transcript_34773/g.72377  ORF Transcript_34773/g.72377 Transcript_34773/m.72377 type:complete len:502 (-) Transcript_34773:225-1730(-)
MRLLCLTFLFWSVWRGNGIEKVLVSAFLPVAPPSARPQRFGSELSEQRHVSSDFSFEGELGFQFHSSIASIPKDDWNSCGGDGVNISAFMDHSWLRCLEESECACGDTGWVAQHLAIMLNGETVGYVPLYLKGHSMGEFIFDNAWAEASYQNGISYYPKMLSAVPFTPATGNRILWHPSICRIYNKKEIARLRQTVATFLRRTAEANKISSVHINFMTEEEATDIGGELKDITSNGNEELSVQDRVKKMLTFRSRVKDDYLRRTSVQYHWKNANPNNHGNRFKSFEEYLGCFKSKRRINIRRERQTVLQDEGILIDAIRGKDILQYPGLVEKMFEIYKSTIDKMYFGRQYLNLEFFQMLAESDFLENLCFMCARYNETDQTEFSAQDVFAGTFNVVKDGVFYGRYWGSLAKKDIKNLHFETCYWSAIEYCIDQGIERMEPGAGGGDYKFARGFDPALIHSVHYICHPALRRAISQYVDYETEDNVQSADYLRTRRKSVGTG